MNVLGIDYDYAARSYGDVVDVRSPARDAPIMEERGGVVSDEFFEALRYPPLARRPASPGFFMLGTAGVLSKPAEKPAAGSTSLDPVLSPLAVFPRRAGAGM